MFDRWMPRLSGVLKIRLSFSSKRVNHLELEEKWVDVIRKYDCICSEKGHDRFKTCGGSYILSMFPYPSGMLHLGHLRVYTVADVLCRYKRLKGINVFYPMGWDAFGLPAENAAIDRCEKPDIWTTNNIQQMREQMDKTMLLSIDWSSEVSTCDPSYYKWTQWLFLKMFAAGLVYRRSAFVNWDPIDQTVLADELVDAEGRSWRSGAVVERRPLRQWYFRTTMYSKSLLDGLREIENNQWRDVVKMQRGWIGQLDGTQIEFDLCRHGHASTDGNHSSGATEDDSLYGERLTVFTRHPGLAVADLVSYIAINPGSVFHQDALRQPVESRGPNSHRSLVLHTSVSGQPSGSRKLELSSTASFSPWPERLAVSALHPFSKREIPMVRISGHCPKSTVAFPDKLVFCVKSSKGDDTSQLLGIPSPPTKIYRSTSQMCSVVESDEVFMEDLSTYTFVTPVTELNSVSVIESDSKAMHLLRQSGRGGYWSSESRTDWLVSRQRYWGTPIPIIHCQSCGAVPVPEDQLPVTLPSLDRPLARGASPLKELSSWRETKCPKCGGPANRETDTLDTFVDSAWYYLRYLDPRNTRQPFDTQRGTNCLPVDIYVGGIEHAIRHLYYARFMAHFLHDLGLLPCREPFLRFLPIGLVLGQTFIEPGSGRFVPTATANKPPGSETWVETSTGLPLVMTWDKMSKSKLNGVDPDAMVQRYGREIIRLTMLANVGPHRARKWQEHGVLQGVQNWQAKLLRLMDNLEDPSESDQKHTWNLHIGSADPLSDRTGAFSVMHRSIISQVDNHYDNTFVLSAVVARLQELTDLLRKNSLPSGGPGPHSFTYLHALADLTVMLAPLAPILACELWHRLHCFCSQAPASIHHLLYPFIHERSTPPLWQYNLEKLVLEQPFPVVRCRASMDGPTLESSSVHLQTV